MGTDGTQIEDQAVETTTTNAKQGHSYCGFCCDMRRAVLIINILSIIGFLVQVIVVVAITRAVKKSGDTQSQEVIATIEKAETGVIILSSIGWFISVYALYGTIKYKVIPVAVQAVYTAIFCLSSNVMQTKAANNHPELTYTWFNWLISFVVSALFIYPHVMLITELRSGIMSPETYAREKQSCCCV